MKGYTICTWNGISLKALKPYNPNNFFFELKQRKPFHLFFRYQLGVCIANKS